MLESIKQPGDLRQLSGDQLTELAAEIRDFLVRAVAVRGGHLGPNLGVVELTIALHRALDSPVDRIVWDTGHQAYVHKLLTGRQDDFAGLRTLGGLSGYPSRAESPHDVIENSHASTALGYALGLAEARALRSARQPSAGHGDGRVVAVVGDGSLTGGVALEALNLIGHRKPDLLVILNDNGRSYAPTVGGLAGHLAPFRLHPGYESLKKGVEETLGRVPLVGEGMVEAAKRVKEGAKALVAPRVVFEDLGWQYAGPVDGHDLAALEKAIDHAKRVPGPVLLHVITQKGRGYPPAEEHEEDNLHSLGAFDPETGPGPAEVGRRGRLHRGVRPGPAGRGPPPPRAGRHLGRHARPDQADGDAAGVPRAGLRRRHRRAGRGDHGRRHGPPGAAAGLRHLLDLPPAGLRPGDHGRRPAPAAGDLRARPVRHHRRGRLLPPRRLRRHLAAGDPQPGHRLAARRQRAAPGPGHRGRPHRRAVRHPVPRARPRPGSPSRARSAR